MDAIKLVKIVGDQLRVALANAFAGERNIDVTRENIKQTMTAVLMNARDTLGLTDPIPRIEVTINGNEAEISLFHPVTGEQISVSEWTTGMYGNRLP